MSQILKVKEWLKKKKEEKQLIIDSVITRSFAESSLMPDSIKKAYNELIKEAERFIKIEQLKKNGNNWKT